MAGVAMGVVGVGSGKFRSDQIRGEGLGDFEDEVLSLSGLSNATSS